MPISNGLWTYKPSSDFHQLRCCHHFHVHEPDDRVRRVCVGSWQACTRNESRGYGDLLNQWTVQLLVSLEHMYLRCFSKAVCSKNPGASDCGLNVEFPNRMHRDRLGLYCESFHQRGEIKRVLQIMTGLTLNQWLNDMVGPTLRLDFQVICTL